jgi:hypothetical protein
VGVLPTFAQRGLSICDYAPPESRITNLGLQGSFSWYDGPYADDRGRMIAASLVADYGALYASESHARQLDAQLDARASSSGWTAELEGSGSVLAFWEDELFGVGAFGADLTHDVRLEADLTAGVGKGRFRDVTPMARAIRIQNALLDLGELLAPIPDEALLELARSLGEVGPSEEERIVRVAERLTATGLTRGEDLDVRALLEIDRILAESDEGRVCGSDVQVRLGVSAVLIPAFRLSATGILLGRYALVPDPVSQVEAQGEVKLRLASPDQVSLNADISYKRRLPDGWTARAAYRLDLDRMWTDAEAIVWAHAVSGTLTTQILGDVGLSLVANGEHRTGDEEITFSVGIHLEATF